MSTSRSQSSVAVAVPKNGMEPHSIGLMTAGQLMTGAPESTVQVTVRDMVTAGFPHASTTSKVLVCDNKHGTPVTGLSA
jgi:hypothetical protein